MTYATGGSYEGHWVDGLRDGNDAKETLPNRDYKGCFKGGLREGRGRLIMLDGTTFDGTWRRNEFQSGQWQMADGTKCLGDMRNGALHCDHALVINPDGSRFEGRYFDGKRSGWVTETNPRGRYVKCYWKDGKPEGRIEAIEEETGNILKGEIQDGRLVGATIQKLTRPGTVERLSQRVPVRESFFDYDRLSSVLRSLR
eukprot:GHVU01055679.1.p1 GENE.GHVU01055679.1~~GHVU01055679.1.p1  ORF type:complete len:199 (+),score=30.10 GHVU01055679.1:278-874(+)